MNTIIKNGKMITLYSYNQLYILLGKNHKRVKEIKDYLGISGNDIHNKTLEAFTLTGTK